MEKFPNIPDPRAIWEVHMEKNDDGKIEMTIYSFGMEKMRKTYKSWKSAHIAKAHYIKKLSQ